MPSCNDSNYTPQKQQQQQQQQRTNKQTKTFSDWTFFFVVFVIYQAIKRMIVLSRITLPLKRSLRETLSLLACCMGNFSLSAGSVVPLPCANPASTILACSSCPLTNSHRGDSGTTLQRNNKVQMQGNPHTTAKPIPKPVPQMQEQPGNEANNNSY